MGSNSGFGHVKLALKCLVFITHVWEIWDNSLIVLDHGLEPFVFIGNDIDGVFVLVHLMFHCVALVGDFCVCFVHSGKLLCQMFVLLLQGVDYILEVGNLSGHGD